MFYTVSQDGANFYIYNGELLATVTIPRQVRDFDMTRAQQSRRDFTKLMGRLNLNFSFE